MFNYNPTRFELITGSSSGMLQVVITHITQQYKYNFWIQLFKIQLLLLKYRYTSVFRSCIYIVGLYV
jgi:hypothetical protein